jgi:5-methyltetrahydropteroyltriglutamate--homocysteine methyltransferase
MELPVDGVGLDFIRGRGNLDALAAKGFPESKVMGIGLVDGRNVWRTDLRRAMNDLATLETHTDLSSAHLSATCSLLHLPHSAAAELALDPSIREWLAFADERLEEVVLLARLIDAGADVSNGELESAARAHDGRLADPRSNVVAVRSRVAGLTTADATRQGTPGDRRAAQQARLGLPPLPTTTIGSFPQTTEIRRARARNSSGTLTDADYEAFLDKQMREVIALQEDLGLDMLVHGEFERSDMVDHFAQRLDGMAFIEGWVQSYGTRCVRPPIIYGDVFRPAPMTVAESAKAQSLTTRPMKGMLTGPVTMLLWSFPRDDLEPEQVALQLALAIRDEVNDLEAAGIPAIQIDEPAFREGLPLRRSKWDPYLEWATRAFRVAAAAGDPGTQIHTHMCYSEFNDIMPAIAALDADVISIESSRSAGELLLAFRDFDYARGIGPGIYDVHSERVPSIEEMTDLIRSSAAVIDPQLLWVNPDCGLKTRGWSETKAALANMVAAARIARAEMFARETA